MAIRDYSDWYSSEREEGKAESGSLAPFTFICVVVLLTLTGLMMLYSASYAEASAAGLPHSTQKSLPGFRVLPERHNGPQDMNDTGSFVTIIRPQRIKHKGGNFSRPCSEASARTDCKAAEEGSVSRQHQLNSGCQAML